MGDGESTAERDWGSLLVALGITLAGVGIVAGSVYVTATTTVTRADYREFATSCGDLEGQSQMVDAGMGAREVTLGEAAVRRCRNTSFEQYRRDRVASMYEAPFNLKQWVLFPGVGGLIAGFGGMVLRQQLSGRE